MTPQELERELRTLEGFERWLESRNGVIGFARKDCDCPLYHYLSEQIQAPIKVASDGIAIGDGRARHSRLSYECTRQIDDGRGNGEPVTAYATKQALKAARRAIGLP